MRRSIMQTVDLKKPFQISYNGLRTVVRVTGAECSQNFDEPTKITIECIVDNTSTACYDDRKENNMYSIGSEPYQITYSFNKEDKMSLAEEDIFNKKNKADKQAVEQGALNKDGLLTEQGKDLLLNLLLQDKDIRTKFDLALATIGKDGKDGE